MTTSRGNATGRAATKAAAAWAVLATVALLASGAAAPAAKGGAPAKVKSVTLAMKHRVFTQFSDVQTVSLQKEFLVGDTDYSAKVVRYVPDFVMELKTGKVVSRSNEPKNPAFEVVVRQKNVPQDTSWAFMNMPPHFGRKSMIAFKIVRIDFVGAPPVVADTTKAATPSNEVSSPTAKGSVAPVNSHSGGTK